MARHWVKLGDNHWAWMSDEEYNKHNSLGCFWMGFCNSNGIKCNYFDLQ